MYKLIFTLLLAWTPQAANAASLQQAPTQTVGEIMQGVAPATIDIDGEVVEGYHVKTVHPISRALEEGGFVASTTYIQGSLKEGLFHTAGIYIAENALVYGDAWVYENARVYENALVYGDAWVYENARVFGNARVYGNARVCGDAWVFGDARAYEQSQQEVKIL